MSEFAFHFGAGGPVVVLPVGGSLTLTGSGEGRFMHPDSDGPSPFRFGASAPKRTATAGGAEPGGAGTVCASADPHGDPVGAGDRVGVEVDVEAVLTEPASGSD